MRVNNLTSFGQGPATEPRLVMRPLSFMRFPRLLLVCGFSRHFFFLLLLLLSRSYAEGITSVVKDYGSALFVIIINIFLTHHAIFGPPVSPFLSVLTSNMHSRHNCLYDGLIRPLCYPTCHLRSHLVLTIGASFHVGSPLALYPKCHIRSCIIRRKAVQILMPNLFLLDW